MLCYCVYAIAVFNATSLPLTQLTIQHIVRIILQTFAITFRTKHFSYLIIRLSEFYTKN
jgi:hypothetical protein